MKKPLQIRILEAVAGAGDEISYHILKYVVYPRDQYPKAHRHSSKGGPPGCAFALGRALNQMQKNGFVYRRFYDSSGKPVYQPDIHILSAGRKALEEYHEKN